MSSRLMKKVLKQQQHEKEKEVVVHHDIDVDDEEEQKNHQPSSIINPFDLLLLHDGAGAGDVDQEDNDSEFIGESSTRDADQNECSTAEQAIVKAVSASSNHKSKKKKKKNTKDPHKTNAIDTLSDNISYGIETSSSHTDPLNVKAQSRISIDVQVKQNASSALQVDPKFLNADNELRRIFGSKVVSSFEKGHQTGTSRQMRGGRRAIHSHRKTLLVSPLDHWPRWDGSLSMEFLETRDGYHYFRYIHSSSYSQAQRAFEAAKAIHDLNGIANILLYHPYHLDSLITLAEYFKFSGEHQMSADATAKCLYALECAWHPMFTPFLDKCQLKYSHESNKPLFSTLFAHMKNMDRRGCHRCALEICKLLLSLDSDDPVGAMFCVDYLSLRAEEYTWLERFSEEYKSDNSLWLFPNFSYSLAVCRFYLERSNIDDKDNGKATSSDLMLQALMIHPSVLKKLVDKVPLKDQAWKNILKNRLFVRDQIGIPSLDHLINIYIERSYIIWRLPDLQKFLKDSAFKVIEELEYKRICAKDWACVREEAFSSEKNEYRHLKVSDFSDSMPTMPPDNLQNFMVGPRAMEMQNEGQVVNPTGGAHVLRDIANRSPLAILFESMLPWNDYGRREGSEDGQNE